MPIFFINKFFQLLLKKHLLEAFVILYFLETSKHILLKNFFKNSSLFLKDLFINF
jgi:hypothetical protein